MTDEGLFPDVAVPSIRDGANRVISVFNSLVETEEATKEIIQRAEEAEARLQILKQIQSCVDIDGHEWTMAKVDYKTYPLEIETVHLRCINCVCSMFLGRGDNRIYAEVDGLDVPLEEYLILPENRIPSKEGEE